MSTLPPPTGSAARTTRDDPPPAPGALGVVLPPRVILGYLDAAIRWRDQLRTDLAVLDQRAQRARAAAALTADVTLAHAMLGAVGARLDEIVAVWDSGRVLAPECERISQLIWGRIEGGGLGMPVSFVEACVLTAAIVSRLRERVDADALAGGIGERLGLVRAQIERLAARNGSAGAGPDAVADLERRLAAITAALDGGARIDPELAALEQAAALVERDVIIAGSRRQSLERDIAEVRERLAAVRAAEEQARRDAATCRAAVVDPPRLAVPDVATLGPVPADRDALDAYAARLALVERAVAEAARRYAAPLATMAELDGLLGSYEAMAAARGRATEPAVAAAGAAARAALTARPCDLAAARTAVEAYQSAVRQGPASGPVVGRLEAF